MAAYDGVLRLGESVSNRVGSHGLKSNAICIPFKYINTLLSVVMENLFRMIQCTNSTSINDDAVPIKVDVVPSKGTGYKVVVETDGKTLSLVRHWDPALDKK